MGLLDRFTKVVQASVKELLEGPDEPEQLLDQAIREMQRELDNARERLRTGDTARQVARDMAEARASEAERFAQQAQQARAESRETAAVEAEGFRAKAQASARKLAEQAAAAGQSSEELSRAVAALEQAIEDTRAKQREIAVHLSTLRQARRAHRVGGSRAEGDTDWRRVPGTPPPGPDDRSAEQVEWELEQLQRRSAVDEKLAELKRKMGGG